MSAASLLRRLLPAALVAPAHQVLLAQAICSAPHSSLTLAEGGSLAPLAPGVGWVQLSAAHQASSRLFGPGGVRQNFLANGEVRTTSLYVTSAFGVLPGLDVWAQIPLHTLSYRDQGGRRDRTGIGDPRASIRIGSGIAGLTGVPVALRAGVKFAGGEFPVDATVIPLTEGQRDWELSAEAGTAFSGVPVYVLGWIGYRWREATANAERRPGNERFVHAALGGGHGTLRWEVASDAMWGAAPERLGIRVPSARRHLVQLAPTVGYGVGPGAVDLTTTIPLRGKNLPTGPAVSVGYRLGLGQ